MTDSDVLKNVYYSLRVAEDALSMAVAEFGPRAGSFRRPMGSLGHFKRMVSAMLKTRKLKLEIERALELTKPAAPAHGENGGRGGEEDRG